MEYIPSTFPPTAFVKCRISCNFLQVPLIFLLPYGTSSVNPVLHLRHSDPRCLSLLYTQWSFPREHCIVLQRLKFTKDYICSSTAEQCRGGTWESPFYSSVWWLPTHSDQSQWYAMSTIRGLIHMKNSDSHLQNCVTVCPLRLAMCVVFVFKRACYICVQQKITSLHTLRPVLLVLSHKALTLYVSN